MPCVDTHAVSESPSQRATAACGSSGLCTWAGVSQVSSTRASAAASPASGSPRTVSRGSSVNRCSSSPASTSSGASVSYAGASVASPAAAASGVSAATAAIGAPAQPGSSVSTGSPPITVGSPGPTHGPHAGRRPCRLEVERGHAGARDRRAENQRVEHPRQGDVDGVARRAARPDGAVQAGRRFPHDVELDVLGPRLDLVVLVDEDPDVLEAALHLPL